ncbi:hypothetical protein [Dyadobacter sp. CY323]|uniref:hypothetical protein n=1 Tax=Dyadobacter sp. CY323 TaxID=2907302 RepID=UPI001F3213AB|nr:hypothetical protein [Dyadobacter sp. CY323]MCE6992567.1 hypothetical protein [Dyadobacter sp. CY323]
MKVKSLRLYTLGYLLLPNLLFFFYWTQWYIALAGILVLILAFASAISSRDFESPNVLTGKDLWILAGSALLLTFVSGVAGLSYQTFDYWCHNTKFYELFKYSWPIRIPETGPVISYYYGYYVVPALIFKLLGSINETVLFLWTMIGFFLGLAWVYIVLNKKIVYALLATTIGDAPHVIKTVFYKFTHTIYVMGDFGVESWSNFENLLWVPNQVIPTLIVGGMFVYLLKNKLNVEHIVFPIALIFWWAVFPAFTGGLLAAIVIIRKWVFARFQLDWILVGKLVILPFLACVPILVFYMSHEEAPISGFLWQFGDTMTNRGIEYAINIGINLVLFIVCYRLFSNRLSATMDPFPLYVILFFFMVFPIYRMGKVNDFLFRGLMPYLLIIGMYLFYPFATASWQSSWKMIRKSFLHLAFFALLLSSSLIAIGRVVRAFRVNVATKAIFPDKVAFDPIPYDAYPNIYEVLKDKWSQREADQYLGKKDSFYELKMAPKKPSDN